MVYTDYRNVLSDIGRVWDQCENRPSESREDLHTIHDQYIQSTLITQDGVRNQVIEELLEVTSQLIISNNIPSLFTEQSSENDDGKFFSISKRRELSSTPKEYKSENRFTWNTIVGHDEAKRSLYECCILPTLLPPSIFVGIRQLCTSVLLYGPPGTGKTTLVRVVAHESHSHLLELYPSRCLSKWAGEAEKRIRDAFQEARSRAPSILFLDELDALASRRDATDDPGARRVLSELLIQISSLQSSDRVTLVAATNRLHDLDPAIIRRFQKTIEVGLPNVEDRMLLLQKGLEEIPNTLTDDELRYLAESTEGWSGSLVFVYLFLFDKKNLCREAVMLPVLEFSQMVFASPAREQLQIRPVVFDDFMNVLEVYQERAGFEK